MADPVAHDVSDMCIDLDCNATTRPLPEVVCALTHAMHGVHHNPSSLHRPGQLARATLERARATVARFIGARPEEIVFTSSATESIVTAIVGGVRQYSGAPRAILTTRLEHAAVIEAAESLEKSGVAEIVYVDHDANGRVESERVDTCIAACNQRSMPVAMVSVHAANNETGVLQPINEIAKVCAQHGVVFHTDATQLVGKVGCDVGKIGADTLSFSMHKFHGPRGVGVLYVRRGAKMIPLFPGSQEQGRRAGTENVPEIVAGAVACDLAGAWLSDTSHRAERVALRNHMEARLRSLIENIVVHAEGLPDGHRLWNTVNVAIPGASAEQMLVMLSEKNICASAGAACSSGSIEPSRVVRALGVPEDVLNSSIRLSFSRMTTRDEIDRAVVAIASCAARLRSFV